MQCVFNPNILIYHPPNSAEGLHFSAFHYNYIYRHTDKHTSCNPRCACAPRVDNATLLSMLIIMKSTKVQTLGGIWRMVYWNIWIENTVHAYVLGEHTSMKNELYIVYRPFLKVRGLSIEPRFSTKCIDLSQYM